MKKIVINYQLILIAVLGSFMFSSCLVEDDAIDFGDTPVVVQFENDAVTANFLKADVDPETFVYDIPVALVGAKNQPLDKAVDLTVSISPNSTATEGVEYNLLTESVTIPAGQMSVPVQIEVLSGNLDAFDPKTLVLDITSASVNISDSFQTSVELQAACPFDISVFYGTYDATGDSPTGVADYTVEVSEGPEENTLLLKNLYNTNGETVVELGTDVLNPTIDYRSKEFGAAFDIHPSYGDIWATTVTSGTSTYKSCDGTLNLEFKRCVGAGCFGGTKSMTLTKQ